jgi:hypothetical protein
VKNSALAKSASTNTNLGKSKVINGTRRPDLALGTGPASSAAARAITSGSPSRSRISRTCLGLGGQLGPAGLDVLAEIPDELLLPIRR